MHLLPEFYMVFARKIFFPNFGEQLMSPHPRLLRLLLADSCICNNVSTMLVWQGFIDGISTNLCTTGRSAWICGRFGHSKWFIHCSPAHLWFTESRFLRVVYCQTLRNFYAYATLVGLGTVTGLHLQCIQ